MSQKEKNIKRVDIGMFAKPEILFAGPNARTNFDPERLAILKEQIRQDGVKQPLIVRRRKTDTGGELEIFDGGRRFRCVQELLAEGHEVEWVPIIIRRASEAELMIEAAMTDQGKEKLDFVDQVNLVRMLTARGMSVDAIHERLGVSVTWVYQRQQLNSLEVPVLEALRAEEITLTKAIKMSKLDSFDAQMTELEKVRERRAAGNKKAGSTTARPGKKKCREMAELVQQTQQLYTSQQVQMLLSWFTGEISEEAICKAFSAGSAAPRDTTTNNVATMH